MIISYKEDDILDISLRLENYNFAPFFQNQMNTTVFDYKSWNLQLQNSMTNNKIVLQLLNDYYSFHQKFFCRTLNDSFYNSIVKIIQCFSTYNSNDTISLSIRVIIYKITICLIRFSKLNPLLYKIIFTNFTAFLFDVSDEDTLYSIQVISLLSKTPFIHYLSKKFFKVFNTSNLQKYIEKKSQEVIYSLCNILINMARYPKINLQFIRNMIILITEIISRYHNPAIISKAITILFNLSKSSLFCFQDLMIKNVDDLERTKISLFDFLQKLIFISDTSDSSYTINSVITVFRIFRRLIDCNNIFYFVCIGRVFPYMCSSNSDLQLYSLKFFYHYLKCLNESVPISIELYTNFLNIVQENKCQAISYLFSTSAIEGTLKMKIYGLLTISELFKISTLFNDIINFCDTIFIESICSFFETQYDYFLFDSISRILIRIIESDEKKEIPVWARSPLPNLILQSVSIENIEYIAENTDESSSIRQLLLALKNMNQ